MRRHGWILRSGSDAWVGGWVGGDRFEDISMSSASLRDDFRLPLVPKGRHGDPKQRVDAVVARLLAGRPAPRVLEAGCGSSSRVALPAGRWLVGVDIAPRQLDKNTVLDEKHLGDLQTFSLPGAGFDLILCWDVIEHLPHPHGPGLRRTGLPVPLVQPGQARSRTVGLRDGVAQTGSLSALSRAGCARRGPSGRCWHATSPTAARRRRVARTRAGTARRATRSRPR